MLFTAAICWAISIIRAIEALLNIGRQLSDQRTLSIQHLRNNVKYMENGLLDNLSADSHLIDQGVLDEGECSYGRTASTCEHEDDVSWFYTKVYFYIVMVKLY